MRPETEQELLARIKQLSESRDRMLAQKNDLTAERNEARQEAIYWQGVAEERGRRIAMFIERELVD